MSADSPSRSRSQTRSSKPTTVSPQQVTDPTILDSVAGFINDVVPTAYNVPCDSKDQIQWVHFEQLESDESTFSPNYDYDGAPVPTVILILGYTTGIQIWAVPANGEAIEILSWRHGSFRVVKIIPNPYVTGAPITKDTFAPKRPLLALCDISTQFLSVTFNSLKTGELVKPIRFQNPVVNVLSNRHSVVILFAEKFAVFDAFTLEPRLSITTCYLSPGIQQNPIALGSRWLAYAEKKLNTSLRSGGGNEGEGVQSYTATVLHAAKSFSRGLRELGETVASSFISGSPTSKSGILPSSPQSGGASDVPQKGIVAILDIENKDIIPEKNYYPPEATIAHFVAHTEAIVCLSFDPSGLLLLTADKRGHDFHLFRIQPHPVGSSLAAVHHLYILHRGDTTAKVQDMCFSPDSRWITVSTLRGTTHVFPVTPYGGNIGVRTHATPLVVNKMSRFHRSAGLTAEGRSNSPVSLSEIPANSLFPYHNPRFPSYPQPVVIHPIAQIRQPVYIQNTGGNFQNRTNSSRQRLSSSEETIALRVVAAFSSPRAWLESTDPIGKSQVKPVEALFVVSCHGTLIQYDLDPRPANSVPKERICNDTPIELKVTAKAQWLLQRQPNTKDVPLPMFPDYLKFVSQDVPIYKKTKPDHNDDNWLSQVEIVTHSGPHRRLWMGPQFTFKTYIITNGAVVETRPLDVRRSKPVNMPISKANAILIESGSASSTEQLFLDTYQKGGEDVGAGGAGETQLKEDLADAMLESPGILETGGHCVIVSMKPNATTVAKVVNPLGTVVTLQSDEDAEIETIEDAVIHENCDEALFRPIVPQKSLFYADLKKNSCSGDILTKSLDSGTEVAVKLVTKSNKNERGVEVKNNKSGAKQNKFSDIKVKKSEMKNFISKSCKSELNFIESQVGKSQAKIAENQPKPKKIDLLLDEPSGNFSVICDDFSRIIDDCLPPSLQSNVKEAKKVDKIEIMKEAIKGEEKFETKNSEEIDCKINWGSEILEKNSKSIDKNPEIYNIQEELIEEKAIPKKSRKPKPKLGVKIQNVNKENFMEKSESSGTSPETITIPPPKRSWNSVVASKLPDKENISEPINLDRDLDISLEIESNFDCNDEIKVEEENILIDLEIPDSNIKTDVKSDKSSDDEKVAESSPCETTESDDSIKIPEIAASAMDTEEDTLLAPLQGSVMQSSKSARRKSKKKRK